MDAAALPYILLICAEPACGAEYRAPTVLRTVEPETYDVRAPGWWMGFGATEGRDYCPAHAGGRVGPGAVLP